MSIAALTCYFNPCGYSNPRRNYHLFREQFNGSGIPLFTAELAFNNSPFELEEDGNITRFRTDSVMWYKERLLNLLALRLHEAFDCLAWVDADLYFSDMRCFEAADNVLTSPGGPRVAQLFDHAVWLNEDLQTAARSAGSFGDAVARKGTANLKVDHPGFAWAAKSEIFTTGGGLYDASLCGSGDTFMACAYINKPEKALAAHGIGDAATAHYRQWAELAWQYVRGCVGAVPGTVSHMWHGSLDDRQYNTRSVCLGTFNPALDIIIDEQGLYKWTGNNSGLEASVADYFRLRREDGGVKQ
jgi:hypothetical protein